LHYWLDWLAGRQLKTFNDPINMLYYALVFLLVAILAGLFGFYNLEGTAAWIAKVLFIVFLVLFVVSLITGRKPKL
jgi:uncharacterized membrane protein YtjA (UPF0391 family)